MDDILIMLRGKMGKVNVSLWKKLLGNSFCKVQQRALIYKT